MLTPAKKTMIKNMALGAGVLALAIIMPKVGPKIADILESVRTKIGG